MTQEGWCRMKKWVLVLLSFVPVVAGYIVSTVFLVPEIGIAVYYILPFLTTAFWFYLGIQYARSTWKPIPAVLIAHAAGIVSLLVYVWQFLLETSETRNSVLASASQMYSSSAPQLLLARIAILFEPDPNVTGMTSVTALQVISVVYMIVVFCAAMIYEKKRIAKNADFE